MVQPHLDQSLYAQILHCGHFQALPSLESSGIDTLAFLLI